MSTLQAATSPTERIIPQLTDVVGLADTLQHMIESIVEGSEGDRRPLERLATAAREMAGAIQKVNSLMEEAESKAKEYNQKNEEADERLREADRRLAQATPVDPTSRQQSVPSQAPHPRPQQSPQQSPRQSVMPHRGRVSGGFRAAPPYPHPEASRSSRIPLARNRLPQQTDEV